MDGWMDGWMNQFRNNNKRIWMKCIYESTFLLIDISHQLIDWYLSLWLIQKRVFNNKTKKKKLKFFTFCFFVWCVSSHVCTFSTTVLFSTKKCAMKKDDVMWTSIVSCWVFYNHEYKKGFERYDFMEERERERDIMLFTTVHISHKHIIINSSLSLLSNSN